METKKIVIVAILAILFLNRIFTMDEKGNINSGSNHEIVLKPKSKSQQNYVRVDTGNTAVIRQLPWNKPAKIMLVVFSDFQCPFSKRGFETTKTLISKYGNEISYVHKHLPLPFHPEALPSAKAAIAASIQGKYYAYIEKLFENQAQLSDALYIKIAKDLGLNIYQFNNDRNSAGVDAIVQADVKQAGSLGVNGTPGFVLNGVKILGAYPLDHYEKVISALGIEQGVHSEEHYKEVVGASDSEQTNVLSIVFNSIINKYNQRKLLEQLRAKKEEAYPGLVFPLPNDGISDEEYLLKFDKIIPIYKQIANITNSSQDIEALNRLVKDRENCIVALDARRLKEQRQAIEKYAGLYVPYIEKSQDQREIEWQLKMINDNLEELKWKNLLPPPDWAYD